MRLVSILYDIRSRPDRYDRLQDEVGNEVEFLVRTSASLLGTHANEEGLTTKYAPSPGKV